MCESFPRIRKKKKKKIGLEKFAGNGTPDQDILQGLLLVAVCFCCLPGSCLDPCCCEVRPPLVGSWVKWTEIKLFLLAPLTTRERRTEVDEFEGM